MLTPKDGVAQKGTENIPLKFKPVDNRTYIFPHAFMISSTHNLVRSNIFEVIFRASVKI